MKPLKLIKGVILAVTCTTIRVAAVEPPSIDTSATQQINQFFESAYQELLLRSPVTLDQRGIHSANDRWDNYSEDFLAETQAIRKKQLNRLKEVSDYKALSDELRLSYDIFQYELKTAVEGYKFRHHSYPINQMFGLQSTLAVHLINMHPITDIEDATAYIQRLETFPDVLRQIRNQLKHAETKGIIAPKFALTLAADQINNLLEGYPLKTDTGQNNALLADFTEKLQKSGVEKSKFKELRQLASNALVNNVKPAFIKLREDILALSKNAEIKGVWSLPQGNDYYQHQLKLYTTTNKTAEEIHQLGWREIRRIMAEIEVLMDKIGFDGDINAFFKYTTEESKFFYPKSEAGRKRAVTDATNFIDGMRLRLDTLFATKPNAKMIVKPVEAFRESTSPEAFYDSAAPDGSRPGIYYINLFEPRNFPIWKMATIAYHEGIPGHHMQLSIAQEKKTLPSFRKFAIYTAYVEGWGMYAEYLPKEVGLYQNPYDDYGRLVNELLRACRLVADTGIHYKRWDRETAIQFMLKHMPVTRDSAVLSVQRYFVWPGQATAYKIGMLKILELRDKARKKLGDDFDIRDFHEILLTNGALPLNLLEKQMNRWIQKNRLSSKI